MAVEKVMSDATTPAGVGEENDEMQNLLSGKLPSMCTFETRERCSPVGEKKWAFWLSL